METHPVGYASNIARVETWECDFNGHWNTRFYTRAFQEASETVALLDGRGSPGAASMRARHIRFHRELRTGDPVLVRSAAIQDGRWQGAVVHWLESDGVLSATALDLPGVDASGRASRHLPRVSEAAVAQALPRGLPHEAPLARAATAGGRRASLGILRPASYDHTGALMFDELFRYIGCATYDFHVSLGYSPQFLARTGISRMVVEMRVNWLGQAPAGTGICSNSWLVQAEGKSFGTAHYVETAQGSPIALVELCLVAVDMKSRRATRVPDFLLAAASPETIADGA